MVRSERRKLPTDPVEMATRAGVNPTRFRRDLRAEQKLIGAFPWYKHNDRWICETKQDYELARKILDRISN